MRRLRPKGSTPLASWRPGRGAWAGPRSEREWRSAPKWPGGPCPTCPEPRSCGPAATAGWKSTCRRARRTRSSPGSSHSGPTLACTPRGRSGTRWLLASRRWRVAETGPGPRRSSRASERLCRLLVVVPYVLRHPGVRIDELTKLFDIGEAELLEDLNLLFMSGLPPYGPGDLIDVQVEEGRVWIDMADYFSRPVRLSRSEALALYLRGKGLLGAPGLEEAPALASALAKIEQALGADTLESLSGRVEVGPPEHVGTALAAIRQAVEGKERLEIEYYSAARDELSTRRIDPEHLFLAIGNWYVVAWD